MQKLSKQFKKYDQKLTKSLDIFLENNVLVGLFLGLLIFISKLPFVNLPFWWDEMNHLDGALKIYQNNFNPFIEWWSYKPPLIFETVALGYSFFGFSRAVPRLIVISFAFVALYFTFLLGKKLYNKQVGFFASILLFFFPLFFAQSSLFHTDLPIAALSLIVFYCYLSKKKIGYFVSGSLIVLTKETGVLVIFAVLAYEIFKDFKKTLFRQLIVNFLFLSSPLLFFFDWLLLNRLYLGWYLWSYNVDYFSFASFLNLKKLITILDFTFWQNFQSLLVIILMMGFILSFFSKQLKQWLIKKELALFLLLTAGGLIFFWWGPFLPRYLLFVYPLFFIVSAASISFFIKNRYFLLLFLIVVINLFILNWRTDFVIWGGEINLNYVRATRVHRQMARYIEQNWSNYEIVTVWPMGSELSLPEMGYLVRPQRVHYLESSRPEIKGEALILTNKIYKGENLSRKLEILLENKEVELVKQFMVEGESLSLYFTEEIEKIIPHLQ